MVHEHRKPWAVIAFNKKMKMVWHKTPCMNAEREKFKVFSKIIQKFILIPFIIKAKPPWIRARKHMIEAKRYIYSIFTYHEYLHTIKKNCVSSTNNIYTYVWPPMCPPRIKVNMGIPRWGSNVGISIISTWRICFKWYQVEIRNLSGFPILVLILWKCIYCFSDH